MMRSLTLVGLAVLATRIAGGQDAATQPAFPAIRGFYPNAAIGDAVNLHAGTTPSDALVQGRRRSHAAAQPASVHGAL